MWLLGRLAPDFKTIADFRKDNGPAIKKVCARFVEVCRKMGLLATASVAIDGSKFKAVNNRDKNFTRGKVERRRKQLEESVARYLAQLDTADRQEPSETLDLKKTRIKERLENLTVEMAKLAAIEKQVLASPDQQVSFTDPDSRSMATSGRGSGVVGYNVQTAVDTENHLIVAHEVTTSGSDRSQLANIARQAKAVLVADTLDVVADRGYFKGEEILACEQSGITVTLPKPMTSGAKASGRFGKQDFAYLPDEDVYRCRPVRNSNAMRTRRETVEHPFGTLKMRMGATHFLCVTLPKVATEMALCVLGYNLTRVLNIVGMKPLLAAVRA
jgi:transposase